MRILSGCQDLMFRDATVLPNSREWNSRRDVKIGDCVLYKLQLSTPQLFCEILTRVNFKSVRHW